MPRVEKRIEDYGLIGDLRTAAMICSDGGIDWLCLPDLDSPSVLAALLDRSKGGYFSVRPVGEWTSESAYLPATNILVTIFRTPEGLVKLTDFMLPREGLGESSPEPFRLYRRIEALAGTPRVEVKFAPRFEYGTVKPCLRGDGRRVWAKAGDNELCLYSSRQDFKIENGHARARRRLSEGGEIWLRLEWNGDGPGRALEQEGVADLRKTEAFWHHWLKQGQDRVLGATDYRRRIDRSALALKLLQYHPTGALAAAATTSLPEEIGGVRNWDYRFSWLRDSALVLDALYGLGYLEEVRRYLRWLKEALCSCLKCTCLECEPASHLQVMFGLKGKKALPETAYFHLDGYRKSRPVRIGNAAFSQRQLDIYGEIMASAFKMIEYQGAIDDDIGTVLRSIADFVVGNWQEKDSGIWEVRGATHHFVHSKVMCWVALDRAVTMARDYGLAGDMTRWQRSRDWIRRDILEKGWHEEKQSFVRHYETDALDASCLLFPVFGFLPFDDPRMVSTVAAVQGELADNGYVYRYRDEDGLPGREGAFLPCSFWLVENLAGQGRVGEAEELLNRLLDTAGPSGLFSEEYDPENQEFLGNYPQALTHVALINSVVGLVEKKAGEKSGAGLSQRTDFPP